MCFSAFAGDFDTDVSDPGLYDDVEKYDGSSVDPDTDYVLQGSGNGITICIDPGHGGTDIGSTLYNGGYEKDNDLKIAMYLKEALEEYSGVTVVMTRTTDVTMSHGERAKVAANNGADLLISIHTDAAGVNTVRGISIFYPNNHYKPELSTAGYNAAVNIQNELTALGLGIHQGITTRDIGFEDLQTAEDQENFSYPATDADAALGTTIYESDVIENYRYTIGDYYGMIRNPKRLGVPAIIVEHGFGNNKDDFTEFMSTDAKLKELALADARGIAATYGLQKYAIVKMSDGNWYYTKNGNVVNDTLILSTSVNGTYGDWYIQNGCVQLGYSGKLLLNDRLWIISNGRVDTSVTNVIFDDVNTWWYVNQGCADIYYTGIKPNEYGWWRIVNGKVDFNCWSVEANEYGWWKIDGGCVNFGFTGLAPNQYGWWYLENGKVNFGFTGLIPNEYGWWCVEGGNVNFGYTGIRPNEYGWWRIVNGKVDFNCWSVEANEYGWWYCEGGKVNFGFTGLAPNGYGWWYCEGGHVNFDYYGNYDGYTVSGGKVIF